MGFGEETDDADDRGTEEERFDNLRGARSWWRKRGDDDIFEDDGVGLLARSPIFGGLEDIMNSGSSVLKGKNFLWECWKYIWAIFFFFFLSRTQTLGFRPTIWFNLCQIKYFDV